MLTHARFFVPARGGHLRSRDTTAKISWLGARHDSGHRSPLMQPLEHVRLFTLLELPGHLGPDLFRVDYPSMEDGPQDPSSRRESYVLRRVEQWSVATARAFALDCAERVVPILEWHAPDDDRPARLLASARAALGQGSFGGSRQQFRRDAGAYEAHVADDACHPAIAPAAGACVAAVRACAWGAVRAVVVLAAEAEASRVAWDAAWTAARDAAWFACTAAETDAQSAAAWDRVSIARVIEPAVATIIEPA